MTRVRMRNFLKIPDGEYELLQVDDDAHWVVRDEHGDVYSEEQHSTLYVVEVFHEGRWVDANDAEVDGLDWRPGAGLGT